MTDGLSAGIGSLLAGGPGYLPGLCQYHFNPASVITAVLLNLPGFFLSKTASLGTTLMNSP